MEIMGMRTAYEFIGQLHDYSHKFDAVAEFGHLSEEKGLRAALEWRDDKFGDDFRGLNRMAAKEGTDFRFPQVLSMPDIKEALAKYEANRKKPA